MPDFFLLGLLPYISYCCMIFEDLGGRRTSKMGAGEKKEPLQKMILKNACEEKMGHRRRRSETTGKKTAPPPGASKSWLRFRCRSKIWSQLDTNWHEGKFLIHSLGKSYRSLYAFFIFSIALAFCCRVSCAL